MFCSRCFAEVSLNSNNCSECGWGLGCVWSQSKDEISRIVESRPLKVTTK